MSKKRIRKSIPPRQRVRHKLTKTTVVALAICVAATGAAVSRWEPLRRTLGLPSPTGAPTTQQSPGGLTLAKEYIYAGGRLIATEEPAVAPPAAPSNLRLVSQALIWNDNSNNESGFKIEKQYDTGNGTWSEWTQVATVEANVTSCNINWSCLVLFRVRAMNAGGDSASSNEVDPCVVFGPNRLFLRAEAMLPTKVALTWQPASGTVDHYEVLRKQSINDNYITLPSNLGPTATTFTDETAVGGVAYLYRVRAVLSISNSASGGGNFAYSNTDLATTIIFEDNPVQARVTTIRAKHIEQLRQAVDAVHVTAGLGPVTWSGPTPAVGDPIRAEHIEQLRANLDQALNDLGFEAPVYATDPTPPLSGKKVMAAHINELRDRVR